MQPQRLSGLKRYLTGKPVNLRQVLARSGQGTVYFTDRSGTLAKIYNDHDDSARFEKIWVMVEFPPRDPTLQKLNHISIAWPSDMIVDKDGHFVGFLMPHIQNAHELTLVYNPAIRGRVAPRFNWRYLHSAALNFISAVEAIHGSGHVIGDIKPQNILVTPQALISIIDTDSFQIRDPESTRVFRCPVGSEGFTPRELLDQLRGFSFDHITRTEVNDRFGIAVIVYLLLFGRHPFMEGTWRGKGDPLSPDERVRRSLWIHAPGQIVAPAPGSIPLHVVHPMLEQCFRRCFIEGHLEPGLRPMAREWKRALTTALEALKRCPRESNHYFSAHSGECYWCSRAVDLGIDVFAPSGRKAAKRAPARARAGSPSPQSKSKPKTIRQRLRKLWK